MNWMYERNVKMCDDLELVDLILALGTTATSANVAGNSKERRKHLQRLSVCLTEVEVRLLDRSDRLYGVTNS